MQNEKQNYTKKPTALMGAAANAARQAATQSIMSGVGSLAAGAASHFGSIEDAEGGGTGSGNS